MINNTVKKVKVTKIFINDLMCGGKLLQSMFLHLLININIKLRVPVTSKQSSQTYHNLIDLMNTFYY